MDKYVLCNICDNPIYYETELYEQDEAYYMDDQYICEDCIRDYIRANHRVKLRAKENYQIYEEERSNSRYELI